MSGFSKMVPQHTHHMHQWTVGKPCSVDVSFYVAVTVPGQPSLLTPLYAAALSGDTCNPTNKPCMPTQLKEHIRDEIRATDEFLLQTVYG
jgi:hypothetical protein